MASTSPAQKPLPPNLSAQLPKLTPRRRVPPATNPSPYPATPALPPVPEPLTLTFTHPVRRIISPADHELFLSSPTYDLLLSFVFTLTDSVRDAPIPSPSPPRDSLHPTIAAILAILDQVEGVMHAHPAEDQQGSRFGNPSFRAFIDDLTDDPLKTSKWHEELGLTDAAAVDEVSAYFLGSFGNRTRIDYGSGHELNFIVWLLTLNRLSLLPASTLPHVVLVLFPRYLSLMRRLQQTYYLEPAGSHGVWGLDDYQFLPFLFGASQLVHHPFIRPLSIHQPLVLEQYGAQYLYLGQVAFVNSVKNVEGLRWHSPMLDDISAAKGGWAKVEGGMRRMFVKEVLGKRVVMQHFLFGGIVRAPDGVGNEDAGNEDADGMVHVHAESSEEGASWGDCCGIRVPGSVAAGVEMQRRTGGGLRRVPFD